MHLDLLSKLRPTLQVSGIALSLIACDGPAAPDDGGVPRDTRGPGTDAPLDGPAPDAVVADELAIVTPLDGDLVLETAVVDVRRAAAGDTVAVSVMGESTPRCTLAPPETRCLVHLEPRATGAVTIEASSGGETVSITLTKESELTDECPSGDAACVSALPDAAGWTGITYENMDSMHASLDTSRYTGITRIDNGDAYSGAANPGRRTADLMPGVLLGNASVAITSPCCQSVPRRSLDLLAISERFRENKLWWYPEHRDHGREDFYWFSTITVGISQGSSGSEIDELDKLMLALGALRTDVRERLVEEGQLWSALQYVSRRTRMAGDAEYLTAAAHPNAIADAPNGLDMIQMVRAFRIDRIPPVARVEVTSEDFMPGERRLTTPESVARIWSDAAATHTITVSAAPSESPTDRMLTYHWVVLRAADDIEVETSDGGRTATFTIARHAEETLMLNGQPRRTSLGVVALFVHDGLYFSPPAFVTSFTADPSRDAPDDNNLD